MTADPFANDPFATPLYDVHTGEILDDEPQEGTPVQGLAPLASAAALAISHDVDTAGLALALRERGLAYAEELHAARPAGRVTQATVQGEVVGLADAADRLDAVGKVFTGAAREIRGYVQELVLEVRGDRVEREGGSTSIRVGDHGGTVKATVTQPTKVSVQTDQIVDVIVGQVAALVGPDNAAQATLAADAARAALAEYQALTSPPSWKITALDRLREDLEAAGDPAAVKLAAAYGKVPHGALRVDVTHEAAK